MYRCEMCGCVVPAGNPAVKRVVETRERTYPQRDTEGRGKPSQRRRRQRGDPGGAGREIVREQLLCAACAAVAEG